MNKITLILPDDTKFISVTTVRAVDLLEKKQIQAQVFVISSDVAELHMNGRGEITKIYKFAEDE